MTEELKAQIKVVVGARQAAVKASEAKNVAFKDWKANNQALFDDADETSFAQDMAEEKLRELTLKAYAETGNKAPVPGVGIRINQKVALDWAKAHKMALSLDKRAFEKMAKAGPETKPDFVKIIEEPQATIATNLEVVE